MLLNESFGTMSTREITIISLESADRLVLGAQLQHVLLESHPGASSCYFSPALEFGDCQGAKSELELEASPGIGPPGADCCMHGLSGDFEAWGWGRHREDPSPAIGALTLNTPVRTCEITALFLELRGKEREQDRMPFWSR